MKQLYLNRETGLVFDPRSGKRFRVNESGAELLKGWQAGKTMESLVEELMAAHGLTQNRAERLYLQFSRQCALAGLTVPQSGSTENRTSVLRKPSAA